MKFFRLITFLLALSLAATACSSSDTPSEREISADGAGADDGSEAPDDATSRTVTLMTNDSFGFNDDAIAAFAEESGIRIELLPSGDAGAALNQAILTKGDPLADVFFGVDNNNLSRALDADLFVAYESPRLADIDPALVIDSEHRVTPMDVGDVCLNIDRGYFDSDDRDAPTSLADLAEADYENLLVVENPATSTPGLAFLLATIAEFGEDGYLDYWSSLRDNGVRVVDGWENAYYGNFTVGSAGEGDRPIVVSYASSPAAEVVFATEPLDVAPTAAVLGTCYRQIEFAGILAGTDDVDGAQQVIDFLLSDDVQAEVPLNMFVYPVIDVVLPPEFVAHAAVATDPYELDQSLVAENRDTWVEAWTDVVIR